MSTREQERTSYEEGKIMNIPTPKIRNKTNLVMINTPVRNETGRFVFRQCRPVLHTEPAKIIMFPTSHDIENRLRHNLRMINITRGIY